MLSSFRHFSLVSHDFSISCYSIYSSGSKLEMREKRLSLSHPENTKRQSKILTDRETSCESSSSLLPLSLYSSADNPRIALWSLEPEPIPAFFAFISHKERKKAAIGSLGLSSSGTLHMPCWDWWPRWHKLTVSFPSCSIRSYPPTIPKKGQQQQQQQILKKNK